MSMVAVDPTRVIDDTLAEQLKAKEDANVAAFHCQRTRGRHGETYESLCYHLDDESPEWRCTAYDINQPLFLLRICPLQFMAGFVQPPKRAIDEETANGKHRNPSEG